MKEFWDHNGAKIVELNARSHPTSFLGDLANLVSVKWGFAFFFLGDRRGKKGSSFLRDWKYSQVWLCLLTGVKRWARGEVYWGVGEFLWSSGNASFLNLFSFSEWKMNPRYCYSFKQNMYFKNESREKWILPCREPLWTTWVLFSRPDMGVLISWVLRFSLGRWKEFQRWRMVIVTQQYDELMPSTIH